MVSVIDWLLACPCGHQWWFPAAWIDCNVVRCPCCNAATDYTEGV